ncbi:hypothetical protein NC981_14855 [Leptolyngbya sp. DQ-M1]
MLAFVDGGGNELDKLLNQCKTQHQCLNLPDDDTVLGSVVAIVVAVDAFL